MVCQKTATVTKIDATRMPFSSLCNFKNNNMHADDNTVNTERIGTALTDKLNIIQ